MATYTINLDNVVLSVNGNTPDGSGNVSITIPTVTNIYNSDGTIIEAEQRVVTMENDSLLTFSTVNGDFVYSSILGDPMLSASSTSTTLQVSGTTVGGNFQSAAGSALIGTSTSGFGVTASSTSGIGLKATSTGGISASIRGKGAVIDNGSGSPTLEDCAILELKSIEKGFLPPRMAGSDAEAIATVVEGLVVYINSGDGVTINSNGLWYYDGMDWKKCLV
jgi:hypothetical protein